MLTLQVLKRTVGSIITALSSAFTSATNSLETIPRLFSVGIRFIVRMSLWTMRLGDVAIASGKILTPRNWLQMGRIDANLVSAKMVNIKPIRNLPYKQLINKTVNQELCSFGSTHTGTNANFAITVIGNASSPYPAAIRAVLLDFRPEAVFKRFWWYAFRAKPLLPVFQMRHFNLLTITLNIVYHTKGV